MKNGFKIYHLITEENASGKEGAYLEECEHDKMNGDFANEVECIHAIRDCGAKGEYVILNVKTF